MVAASPANALTRISSDMDKATFQKFKRNFVAFAGSNKFMDGLLEVWRNPVDDPGAEPVGEDAAVLHQKNLWQHRKNAFSAFQDKQDESRSKAWQHLIYICEGNSTLEELVNSHEAKDILLRNKDLWQAICDEYEVHAETSSAAAPCLALFKLQLEDTGNPLDDFKILVAKIDKISQDCARNHIELADTIKLAKLQDALSHVQKFDHLQVLSVLEGATIYAGFVTKIKTASGVQSRIDKGRPSSQLDKKKQHQTNEHSGVSALKTQFLDHIGDTNDPTVKQFASYVKNFKGKAPIVQALKLKRTELRRRLSVLTVRASVTREVIPVARIRKRAEKFNNLPMLQFNLYQLSSLSNNNQPINWFSINLLLQPAQSHNKLL
jgi:hypothetical protein